MRYLFVCMLAVMLPFGLQAAEFKEGVHYQRLPAAQPVQGEQVEVIEFFWYGCPHCADFEPYIQRWKSRKPDNVKLTLVPAVFRKGWVVHAKAFYAAELLGVLDETHSAMFNAMHRQKKPVNTPEQIAEVFATKGVEKQKFLDAMNSFAVDAKVKQAIQLIRDYRIQGVPAIAVNGKYLTGGSLVGSYDNLLNVMDYLVALESQS